MDVKSTPASLMENFTQALRDTLTLLRQHAGNPKMSEKWKIICEARDTTGKTLISVGPDKFDEYCLRDSILCTPEYAVYPKVLWQDNEKVFFREMGTTEESRNLIHTMPTLQTYTFIIEADAGGKLQLVTRGTGATIYTYSGKANLQIKESAFEFSDPWFQNLWVGEPHILGECTRVFLRLTAQPDGSLVDLWDLIDDRPLKKKYAAYLIIREILTWTCKKATPPAQYDAGTGVFTKTSETFDTIKELLREFARWGESGKK